MTLQTCAQILISGGTYSQSFDSLGTSSAQWTNNLTLPGWYASKAGGDATNFLAGSGAATTGGLYSFGSTNATDRALGSLAASSTTYAFGVRFKNDTGSAQTNIAVSCIGEQWRSGSTTNVQSLTFSYQVSNSPITNTYSASGWSNFPALNFVSPNLSAASTALDGNAATNRQNFASVLLNGVIVQPGQELFLRWVDVDDSGFDNALAIDDFSIQFNSVVTPVPPFIVTQPANLTVTAGAAATFSVQADGSQPLRYQWKFYGTNLLAATNSSLILNAVTVTQAGPYSVSVTNVFGSTNSQPATLTVLPAEDVSTNTFSLLHYNVKGNGATNWTTNAAQVQAIGRQLKFLKADIVEFNEIPNDYVYEMTNWITAFMPGYYMVTNSGTDGYIRSVICSRFPITRSRSWLTHSNLSAFGYSGVFTRDLFEAQIAMPGFPQPLHVFSTHLKASATQADTDKRGAEASAISNYLVTVYFSSNSLHPYILSGDLNEDIVRPETNNYVSSQPVQRLVSAPTGLRLTTPVNPTNGSDLTLSIQGTLDVRFDYILPCSLLFSNIASSQVFRTDLLNPVPPNLNSNDDKVASDHLPVLMVFRNPYDRPFALTSITRSNPVVTLTWNSLPGQPYRVESSSNLASWSTLVASVLATNYSASFKTNVPDASRFFRVYRFP